MKTSIIYATKTNHSKKLAEAIASALQINIENISIKPDLKDIELLFIVGGIYGGESLPELKNYVASLNPDRVKSVALITNCLSRKQRQISIRKILEEKGIPVIDEYICRGSLLFLFRSHPDKNDCDGAVNFAKNVLKIN